MCGAHLRWFSSRTQPRQRGASLRCWGGDRGIPEDVGTIQPLVGDGLAGNGGGWLMSNVLSLQLARERARQSRGGSNGHAFKRPSLPLWNSEITGLDERRVLARLEAENAQLRRRVVDLLLQIQALRDGAGTLSAYDAARHRRDVP
jgi:hypothetical protein